MSAKKIQCKTCVNMMRVAAEGFESRETKILTTCLCSDTIFKGLTMRFKAGGWPVITRCNQYKRK